MACSRALQEAHMEARRRAARVPLTRYAGLLAAAVSSVFWLPIFLN
jgi:hypothetical protein